MLRAFVTALVLGLLAAGCASAPPSRPMAVVPDKLKPAASESLAMIVPAKGVQVYECRARKDQAGEYEWAFVAPEADLFDARGNRIGRHYAGPHWEAADGSKISGTVKERADAPVADAIPWLLLTARSVGPDGAFSKVTSIQRVNTGRRAPPRRLLSVPAGAPLAQLTGYTFSPSSGSGTTGARSGAGGHHLRGRARACGGACLGARASPLIWILRPGGRPWPGTMTPHLPTAKAFPRFLHALPPEFPLSRHAASDRLSRGLCPAFQLEPRFARPSPPRAERAMSGTSGRDRVSGPDPVRHRYTASRTFPPGGPGSFRGPSCIAPSN